jgi:transcriptional regulator GlxA family with amidase domain
LTQVVFLLTPGLHLLDLAGPAQAFSSAADLGQHYDLRYVAEQEDVPTAQGVTVRASLEWPALTADDLIMVPGWEPDRAADRPADGPAGGDSGDGRAGERAGGQADGRTSEGAPRAMFRAETLDRLNAHHRGGGTVASVCAGAFALAAAGLLDGRRCTTHHELQDELAARHPRAGVVRDVLYVFDGRVVTSAGIASGIDLALHLIAQRHGPQCASRVAREMVVYARRNGDEQQASIMLRHRSHVNDAVHRVQDVIDARFAERLPLSELAAAGGISERTLTRLFDRAIGMTPLRYQQLLRVERAEHLIGHGATVEAAARAVGFEDARMLRRLRRRAASEYGAS